jgi:type III secretion protein F
MADGLLVKTSTLFEKTEAELNQKEQDILDNLAKAGGSSNPYVLAQYQAVVSELQLMHTTRSSILSVIKQTSKEIVDRFR